MTHWESSADGLVRIAVNGDNATVTVHFDWNRYSLTRPYFLEERT
jgi:hypothetical protein